jgi:hypothetical protein
VNHNYPWLGELKSRPRFQPSSQIFFPVNVTDSVSLDVMIAYGASSLANSSGSPQMTSMAVKYQSDAIRAILDRIKVEKQMPSIPLIIAVTGSICTVLETVHADKNDLLDSPLVKLHVGGLRSLIKSKRGWDEIKKKSMPAAWLIFW